MNTRHVHVPATSEERKREIVDAAKPHPIVPCVADGLFLVPPDEVDSVIARVPALVEWVATGAATGQQRELASRVWVAVRFFAIGEIEPPWPGFTDRCDYSCRRGCDH